METVEEMVQADHGESSDDKPPDLPDNPGLYYPLDYVLMTWREKNEHGILPEPGGLNDQDWRLVYHDWPLITSQYNRLSRELYPSEEDKQKGWDNPTMPDLDHAAPFEDLLKE